jgi:hypothetical protein
VRCGAAALCIAWFHACCPILAGTLALTVGKPAISSRRRLVWMIANILVGQSSHQSSHQSARGGGGTPPHTRLFATRARIGVDDGTGGALHDLRV